MTINLGGEGGDVAIAVRALVYVQWHGIGRQRGVDFRARRQYLFVAIELGGQVPGPAGGVPALAMRGQFGFVEDDGDGRIGKQPIETVERLLDRGLKRDEQRLGAGRPDAGCVRLGGIRHQYHIGAGFT